MKVAIPYKLQTQWEIDKDNILESRMKVGDKKIFKFCYHPASGEFIFGAEPESHKEMIVEHGIHRFECYVRGIYFREKKTVYLRMHEREPDLLKTCMMLRQKGLPDGERIIWGEKAAKELVEELRGL